jgi:hypothetical protein
MLMGGFIVLQNVSVAEEGKDVGPASIGNAAAFGGVL